MLKFKMPNKITKGVIAGTALLIGSMVTPLVYADPIYTPDTLLGAANSENSSDGWELMMLRDLADNNTLVLNPKTEVPEGEALNFAFDDEGQWYINAPSQPGYFVLKFGIGGTDAENDTFFFRNIEELDKLVWTNDLVEFLTGGACSTQDNCNIDRLSHYVVSDPDDDVPPTGIPEPGSVALAGLGMLSLWLSRRSLKK